MGKAESAMQAAKSVIAPVCAALYDYDAVALQRAVGKAFAPDARIHLAHPFETLKSAEVFLHKAITPLYDAFRGAERRDFIVMAGRAEDESLWVGCCGHYMGMFVRPFLDIPPTGHLALMRFHEFFRIEDGQIKEMQALWDIPELMLQARAWPMAPALGREWQVCGPATQDGFISEGAPNALTSASRERVKNMLVGLSRYAEGGVEAMRLEDHWHPHFKWYGPSGIGTAQGIAGFRNWHQIPFLNAMPDRRGSAYGGGNLFAEGAYVGFTAWPGMQATISGDGWMGIVPSGQKITLRSLDFWRCERGKIRENWVLVDLLHVYAQIGVDVLARMREFNKARPA